MRYHLTTKGGSLLAQEAIIEEENEANLPAFVGPLDPAIPEAKLPMDSRRISQYVLLLLKLG